MSENRWQAAAKTIEALPAELAAVRKRAGLSERAAAKAIGIGHGTVRNAELGRSLRSGHLLLVLKWLAEQNR